MERQRRKMAATTGSGERGPVAEASLGRERKAPLGEEGGRGLATLAGARFSWEGGSEGVPAGS